MSSSRRGWRAELIFRAFVGNVSYSKGLFFHQVYAPLDSVSVSSVESGLEPPDLGNGEAAESWRPTAGSLSWRRVGPTVRGLFLVQWWSGSAVVVPVTMESSGVLGPETLTLIQDLGEQISRDSGTTVSWAGSSRGCGWPL